MNERTNARGALTDGRPVSIAVDVGGTFTDILLRMTDGTLVQKKVLSSVDDYGRSIVEGVRELLDYLGIDPGLVGEIRHGTTVASNTILERKGAKVGLIGTAGFRDLLEIRNLRMPVLYDLRWDKPTPLVPRLLRATVTERMAANGEVVQDLDRDEAEKKVRRLVDEGIEALAVCLINSFVNPSHEHAIREIAERVAPGISLSLSSDVLPEIKEYERTSTTVVNAYVGLEVRRYLGDLQQRLVRIGIQGSLRVMQSNGSLMTTRQAIDRPVHIIESGPAAGVVGAQAAAIESGLSDLISFDMGGTTAKASLIENHMVTYAADFQVGGGLISGSRLLTGAGYLVKVPAIDIAEVGAGGGSIVHIDRAGGLKVGPRSAGAFPGPVCYGFGGQDVTITDANLILGYINPVAIAGGTVPVNREASIARFDEMVARPLGVSVAEAAHGAFLVATSTMIRAIRAVTVERGRDPRRFSLIAFGGNGPIFANAVAEALNIDTIIVPLHAGLFSAVGLLAASPAAFRSCTFKRRIDGTDAADIDAAWRDLEMKAATDLGGDNPSLANCAIERRASLRYVGQRADLTISVPPMADTATMGALLAEAFAIEHLQTYGHRAGVEEPVELVSLQVFVQLRSSEPARNDVRLLSATMSRGISGSSRRAYFGPRHGWLDTPVIGRGDLAARRPGPFIVEEPDTASVVPPDMFAELDRRGNIIITRNKGAADRNGSAHAKVHRREEPQGSSYEAEAASRRGVEKEKRSL